MKIVLDTNVLVSALISPRGSPAQILRLILEGHLTLCVDPRIAVEYRDVIPRPEWSFDLEDANEVLTALLDEAVVIGALPAEHLTPDRDDQVFVDTAVSARADALVTGNKRHFPAETIGNARVLSPAEFMDFMRKKEK
ncbi:MAG: putative toxin-antitoxin system toxin component, PIN family [bacterium]